MLAEQVLFYTATTWSSPSRRGVEARPTGVWRSWSCSRSSSGSPNTVLRAQVPGYLLFALVLTLLLSDAAHRSRRVYLALPLLALWANVHGSVLLGAVLVTLYGVTVAVGGVRARAQAGTYLLRAGALIAAPWLCVLVSPYGLSLPGYYRRVLDNPTLSHAVSEWGPSTLRGQPLFFALLLGGLVVATLGRRHLTPFAFLALVGTGLFGLLAVRNIVWFAFVAAAVLPAGLDAVWRPSPVRRKTGVNLLLAVGSLGFLAVITAVIVAHGNHWFAKSYPDRASQAVQRAALADPKARVFANERYADWLLFEHPDLARRVAYDTRFEIIPPSALERVVAFRSESGSGWQRAAEAGSSSCSTRRTTAGRSNGSGAAAPGCSTEGPTPSFSRPHAPEHDASALACPVTSWPGPMRTIPPGGSTRTRRPGAFSATTRPTRPASRGPTT